MPNPDIDQHNKRRTSKTSVACQACKRRKTKCSGGPPPCQACIKLSSKCIIDPGTDMRRRDSKDTLRPNKALLDALVRSVQDGDKSLTDSLYRAIQAIDSSGRLSTIAQSYLQDPFYGPDGTRDSKNGVDSISSSAGIAHLICEDGPERETWSNSGDGCQTVLDAHASVSSASQASEPTLICERCAHEMNVDRVVHEARGFNASRQSLGRTLGRIGSADLVYDCKFLKSFEELTTFWDNLKSNVPQGLLVGRELAQHGFDPWNNGSVDTASSAIISFRDLARQNLHRGANIVTIIGTSRPNLDAFFGTDTDLQPDSAWSWSCRFVRTFPNLSLPLQLSKIYLLAIQMRVNEVFSIHILLTPADMYVSFSSVRIQTLSTTCHGGYGRWRTNIASLTPHLWTFANSLRSNSI